MCGEEGAFPFVKCQEFEGPKAGYVFKLDDHGLGYYIDDRRKASCASAGLGLECGEWPKYLAGLLEHSLSLPSQVPVTLCLDHLLFDAWLVDR